MVGVGQPARRMADALLESRAGVPTLAAWIFGGAHWGHTSSERSSKRPQTSARRPGVTASSIEALRCNPASAALTTAGAGLKGRGRGPRSEADGAGFRYHVVNGVTGMAAELVGVVNRQHGVDPSFDLDAQCASGPARISMGMVDARDAGRGVFGGHQDPVVNAVEQAAADIGGDLVADVADEQGDS